MMHRLALMMTLLLALTIACSKKSDPTADNAPLGVKGKDFPVLTGGDWKPVLLEAIAADPLFTKGVLQTSTKYLNLSSNAMGAGKKEEAARFWSFGHLLAWYAVELMEASGVPAAEQRALLLKNRAMEVQLAGLTIESLRASFDAMNSQLELLGRPKCKSLSTS